MNILTGYVIDALATLPDGHADAVVSVVPVNCAARQPTRHSSARPINSADLGAIVHHLLRISRGPIVLVTVHAHQQWAEALERCGRLTATRVYANVVDVVVGSSARPTLPASDTDLMRPLLTALIESATQPDDVVLDPFAASALAPLAIHAAGRRLTAIVPTSMLARAVEQKLTADRSGVTLTEQEEAEIIRLKQEGRSQNGIARRLGVRQSTVANVIARHAVKLGNGNLKPSTVAESATTQELAAAAPVGGGIPRDP